MAHPRQRPSQSLTAKGQQPARALDGAYLTSQEAIEFLSLPSIGALYHHIRENRLPYGRIGGRYRFNRRALEAWVEGQRDLRVVRIG